MCLEFCIDDKTPRKGTALNFLPPSKRSGRLNNSWAVRVASMPGPRGVLHRTANLSATALVLETMLNNCRGLGWRRGGWGARKPFKISKVLTDNIVWQYTPLLPTRCPGPTALGSHQHKKQVVVWRPSPPLTQRRE